jgi:hypothetical protein
MAETEIERAKALGEKMCSLIEGSADTDAIAAMVNAMGYLIVVHAYTLEEARKRTDAACEGLHGVVETTWKNCHPDGAVN